MNNSSTIDRRDVLHPANSLGGRALFEQLHAPDIAVFPEDSVDGRQDGDTLRLQRPVSPSKVRSAH